MRINNIGIQNYQQLNRQENSKPGEADRRAELDPQDSISIDPRSQLPASALAVKAPAGTYADALLPQERQALELLFARFRESGRFTAGTRSETDIPKEMGIGTIIDVKV